MAKQKILIADDEAQIREILRIYFEKEGFEVIEAEDGAAAIGIFRAGKTLGKSVSIVVNDPTKSIRPLIAGYVNNPDYEPSMFVDSEQAKDMVDNNTVVVVVDTNRPSYTECEEHLRHK